MPNFMLLSPTERFLGQSELNLHTIVDFSKYKSRHIKQCSRKLNEEWHLSCLGGVGWPEVSSELFCLRYLVYIFFRIVCCDTCKMEM